MRFEQIYEGIFLLKVPFEDLYTSVFAVVEGRHVAIIDAATTAEDVDTYIAPAVEMLLEQVGGTVSHLLLTHTHGDHAGGIGRLSERYPQARVCSYEEVDVPNAWRLTDGDKILGRICTVHLPGHTRFSVGYLCERTGVLLSGDCLQLRGVGKYTKGVRYPELYFASIERLKNMEINGIVASHDYVPLGQFAEGKEAVLQYLEECRKCISES
jgi:glyoxylase-like metal-dependent hydrolase (beta-lactamase superfamily II)